MSGGGMPPVAGNGNLLVSVDGAPPSKIVAFFLGRYFLAPFLLVVVLALISMAVLSFFPSLAPFVYTAF
jgi:hypothetical protein